MSFEMPPAHVEQAPKKHIPNKPLAGANIPKKAESLVSSHLRGLTQEQSHVKEFVAEVRSTFAKIRTKILPTIGNGADYTKPYVALQEELKILPPKIQTGVVLLLQKDPDMKKLIDKGVHIYSDTSVTNTKPKLGTHAAAREQSIH